MKQPIYLDYAAATPMDPAVIKAMQPYFSDNFYNPSATYLAAKAVKNELDAARSSVAQILGAKPAEIIFTSGATEANNLAIQGVMDQFPQGELLISAIEHDSVYEPAQRFKHQEIPVDSTGLIILNKLSNLMSDKTLLISVMLVNNELGTIQSLREVSALVSKVRKQRLAKDNHLPLYLHTDAAQAGNYLDIHASRLGIDLMSLNGGKLYGPKQSGGLFVKAGTKIKPLVVGGGQEFGVRSGTENVAGAIGFARALELASANKNTELKRVAELRDLFEDAIAAKVPQTEFNGSKKHRAPHISNVRFDGFDNERLMMELDEKGIICALGSACSASSELPSRTLQAIGLDRPQIQSSLRFSLGKHTSQKDIETTAAAIADLIVANR
jgi:cysteine desulfurase